MLKELLEHIGSLAIQAELPKHIPSAPEPSHCYWLALPGGKLQRVEAEPPPRQHRAGDLTALVEMVQRQARQIDGGDTGCVLWYSRSSVTLLLDDETRRDRLTLPLSLHPQLVKLQALEEKKPTFDQKGFVALLRIDLAGCLGPAGNLLDIVRKVQFKQRQDGNSTVAHGKASIGRSIESELTGAGIIPEECLLDVPVFHGPLGKRRYRIACAIEVDAANERFQLVPYPGSIEFVICEAEQDVGEDLRAGVGEAAAVYYGVP